VGLAKRWDFILLLISPMSGVLLKEILEPYPLFILLTMGLNRNWFLFLPSNCLDFT